MHPGWLTISEDALRTDPRGAPISDDPAVADLVDKESSGVDHDIASRRGVSRHSGGDACPDRDLRVLNEVGVNDQHPLDFPRR
jgi:hypothetical protein